jgi:DNA-directed RNA polymerase specialized sigma54-like protein
MGFQTRLAGLLELPEREYSQLIAEIEADPLFIKLKYAENRLDRAIRSRRLQQTDLSRRFMELKEDLAVSSGDEGGAEVEKLLAGKDKIVDVIRKLGEDDFKRYFIYNDEELSLSEIADNCELKPAEVKEILSLINTVDVYSEFFTPSTVTPGTGNYNYKIATLARTGKGIAIQFNSAHWARGLYEVDHDKIEKMMQKGRITKEDGKRLKKLLEKIEFVNLRKSLLHNIISKMIEKQRKYFQCRQENGMVPFMQIELARELKVHPSIISRATSGRSIETPWGEEKPLKAFFVAAGPKQREEILRHIRNILREEKYELQKGSIKKPSGDKEIAAILLSKYGVSISQRTVAKYRNSMKISGAFHR